MVNYLFIQIFRNRILRSQKLKSKIQRIESVIRANYHRNEPDIVSEIVKEWNSDRIINLSSFVLNGINYDLWIEFRQIPTHGKPYVTVIGKIEIGNNDFVEYETEFGDIAIVVEYYLEKFPLSRKISVLQTKKETRPDQTKISLHQLYLMWFWPSVCFKSHNFRFKSVNPEEFSFCHFILDKSNHPMYPCSMCSSPFVGVKLGLTKPLLINHLKDWLLKRKINSKQPPPSSTLKGLLPGAVENLNAGRRYSWSMIPKPFGRFLLEAAYLFVGTQDDEILELARLRVPNVLLLKVRAAREESRWLDINRAN